jgi:hypothetical protein
MDMGLRCHRLSLPASSNALSNAAQMISWPFPWDLPPVIDLTQDDNE